MAAILRFRCNMNWKTNKLLNAGAVHKYFGYFMLLATQFTLFTGFNIYGSQNEIKKRTNIYAILNVSVFFGVILVCEIVHQLFIRKTNVVLITP